MFDIGWSEMAIIMLLALIIIGPKDLPRVARTIGQWVRKGRAMAREFQTSLEEMARDTELEDVKKEIEKVGRMDFKKSIENTIDPKGELTKAFDASVDETEDKPALTDPASTDKAATTANGHANGTTAAASSSKASVSKVSANSVSASKAPPSVKTRTKTARATKTPAAKAKTTKTAARAKKPAAKTTAKTGAAKTVAAKKPASPAKRSAKPTASASGAKPKRSTVKRGADPSPVDEGGGTDQAAVAAKSS